MKKALFALIVTALMAAFATSAGAVSDVTDPKMQVSVSSLQSLGVVEGFPDGTFRPNDSLTRAQFSKIIVEAMNASSLLPTYKNYTVFPDAPHTHWAAPYINVSVKAKGIVNGYPDGTFRPDDSVTGAEAVTIVLRILGYSIEDIGALWPTDYIQKAISLNLIDQSFNSSGALSRGNAAVLVHNMLIADTKEGSAYAASIGLTAIENKVIIATSDTSSDLSGNQIKTDGEQSTPLNCLRPMPTSLLGIGGIVLTNSSGDCVGFVPYRYETTIGILSNVTSTDITLTDGKKFSVPSATPVVVGGEKTTYIAGWFFLRPGGTVTISQSSSGAIEMIAVTGVSYSEKNGPFVYTGTAKEGVNPLLGIFSHAKASAPIYKNGALVEPSDIRQYDVVSYNETSGSFQVCDYKLMGAIEAVYPSPVLATSVRIFGQELEVLPSARTAFAGTEIRSIMTLVLTADLKVAGAYPSATLNSPPYAILMRHSGEMVFYLLDSGMRIKADLNSSEAFRLFNPEILRFRNDTRLKSTPSLVNTSSGIGAVDLKNLTLGNKPLSPHFQIFERPTQHCSLTPVDMESIALSSIPSSAVREVINDYAGRPQYIVVDSVTGEAYTYGIIVYNKRDDGGGTISVTTYDKNTQSGSSALLYDTVASKFGGIHIAADGSVRGYMPLSNMGTVGHNDFNMTKTVTVGGKTLDLSNNVVFYNQDTEEVVDLKTGLASCNRFDIYQDTSSLNGGKVRIISGYYKVS